MLEEDLQAMQSSGLTCIVLGGTEKTASNIAADLKEKGLPVIYMPDMSEIPDKGIIVTTSIQQVWSFPTAGFGIITHGRYTGTATTKRRKNKHAQELYSLSELTVGDYIVHASHGIGVFEGIHKINMQGVVKDCVRGTMRKKILCMFL